MGEIDWRARLEQARELSAQVDEIIRASHQGREAVAQELLGAHFIGPEQYKEIFGVTDVGTVLPLPGSITAELLNQECPLVNDGTKIKDTHRLVFIPHALDGEPLTINSLRELAMDIGPKRFRGAMFPSSHWYAHEAFANTALSEGRWILMPMLRIPGTLGETYAAQDAILKKDFPDYHTATAFERVVGLVMNDLHVGGDAGGYAYLTGSCADVLTDEYGNDSGRRVNIGNFQGSCLEISDNGLFGRAALRNLE